MAKKVQTKKKNLKKVGKKKTRTSKVKKKSNPKKPTKTRRRNSVDLKAWAEAGAEVGKSVHFGWVKSHGHSPWHEAVSKYYALKLEESLLHKKSDTSVYNPQRRPIRPTASALLTSNLVFGSLVVIMGVASASMMDKILEDLISGDTGKAIRNFMGKAAFKKASKPISYHFEVKVLKTGTSVSVLITGDTPEEFQASVEKMPEAKSIATIWWDENRADGKYVTFRVHNGKVDDVPNVSVDPVKY